VSRRLSGPRVGSVVFLAVMLTITIALGLVIGEVQFRPTNDYTAEFSDSSGLKEGEEVRVAGVRVGEISDTRLTPRNSVLVTFTAGSEQRLTGGTRALARLKNLTGDHFLQLADGPGPPRLLQDGDAIPLERTAPALDLNVLLAGFRPLLRALDPGQVNQLASSVVAVLQGQTGTVQDLLGNIGSLTNTLADRDAVIGRVVENTNAVLGTLDERDRNLSSLITGLQQLVTGLSEDRQVIGQSLEGINDLTTTTAGLLQEARPPLREDIVQLGRLSEVLNRNQDTLDLVLSRLPTLYPQLSRIGRNGSFFNFYICDLRVRTTGPTGQDVFSPTFTSGRERCDPR
jgi:phospholipid/cholesterol/gamma-HCH transport system substrate-binding protein